MSTHNICFREEIKKIFCGYSLLSGAMLLPSLDINKQDMILYMKQLLRAQLFKTNDVIS